MENKVVSDIEFVKSILPEHYTVQESKKKGSIHCKSEIGIRKAPYKKRVREYDPMKVSEHNPMAPAPYRYKAITITDAEDEEHWEYIFQAIKQHFGERFLEVFHNTCFCHVDFTVYLKQIDNGK
jgi:hypothetical protein